MKALLMVFIVCFAVPSLACTCGKADQTKSYVASSTIFSGKVTSLDKDKSGQWQLAKVQSDHVYKGAGANFVRTAIFESSCGYTFQVGQSYLIWATENGGQLSTGLCSLTKPLLQAETDIAWLQTQPH